jgi:polysaccharide biosynthesis transport protein
MTSIAQKNIAHNRKDFMKGMPILAFSLKRNFWSALASFASVLAGSYFYLKTTPQVYEGSSRLILDDRRVSVSDLGQALATNTTSGNANPIATQAELVSSERVLKRALEMLSDKQFSQKITSTGKIASGLRVKIVPATNILELQYKDSDPELVAAVLNSISEAMVQENGRSIRQQASSVRKFIEGRIPEQKRKLTRVEADESRFKQTNGIISLETQDSSLTNSLIAIEDQERILMAQIQEAQQKSEQLQKVTGSKNVQSAYVASRAGQDDELKALRTRLIELESQIVEARGRFSDEHPSVINLLQKRDSTSALYNQSLQRIVPAQSSIPAKEFAADDLSRSLISTYITSQVELNASIDKLKAIRSQKVALQVRLTELPAKQQILTGLVRKREQEAATLKLLQNKLEEARIAEAQLVSNVHIIGLASVPTSPASPKPMVILVLGTAAGLVLAIGVIILGEMLNTKIGSAEELQQQIKLPVLGNLSERLSIQPGQMHRFLNNSEAVEPYRRLLKQLQLSNKNQLKSILISSSVSGEGKSSVCAYLATVATMSSKRTLLIDADLSNPLQHYFFNLSAQPGLTDAVSEDVSLLSLVQHTDIEGLDILTHGELSNHHGQVVEAIAMKKLIATAMTFYDLVIVDASPVSNYTDVMTLSGDTDGVVLVVRPDFTPKAIAQQTIDDLQRSGVSILGTVVNVTPDPTNILHESKKKSKLILEATPKSEFQLTKGDHFQDTSKKKVL